MLNPAGSGCARRVRELWGHPKALALLMGGMSRSRSRSQLSDDWTMVEGAMQAVLTCLAGGGQPGTKGWRFADRRPMPDHIAFSGIGEGRVECHFGRGRAGGASWFAADAKGMHPQRCSESVSSAWSSSQSPAPRFSKLKRNVCIVFCHIAVPNTINCADQTALSIQHAGRRQLGGKWAGA